MSEYLSVLLPLLNGEPVTFTGRRCGPGSGCPPPGPDGCP